MSVAASTGERRKPWGYWTVKILRLLRQHGCMTAMEIYEALDEKPTRTTLYKALERLAKSGIIRRVARGKYCFGGGGGAR